MIKRLLTIQDVSCVGQCSATVALPVVSACGVECAVLPSAVLSNHTGGFSAWTFRDLTDEMPRIEAEWQRQKIAFDAFYTGYVCPAQIEPILSIFKTCAAPGAVRFVDPVMADNGKLYTGFGPDFPSQMARLCAGADYILPNLTEASFLLGRPYVGDNYDQAYIEDICRGLVQMGAKNVVLTGVSFDKAKLGAAVYHGADNKFEYYFNEKQNAFFHGTGDVFASAFAGAMMRGKTAIEAAAIAADFVVESIKRTMDDMTDHWYGVKFEKAIPSLVRALGD